MKQRKARTLTISIPGEYYDKLEYMAKKDDRSKNYLIRKAIDNYLEDVYLSEKAEKVLKDGICKTYSLEEIKVRHGL